MSRHLADKYPIDSNQARRELSLRRAYQRQLGHKPTLFQRSLMDTAAVLQVRFEVAAADPNTSHNDLVRLRTSASAARNDMLESFQATKPKPVSAFDAYIQQKQRASA